MDPIALQCPDYFDIVRKPMSFDIIFARLGSTHGRNRQYQDVQDFVGDVRQIWQNCRLYNAEKHPVRLAGERLSDAWERKRQASDLEAKFATEGLTQQAEDTLPWFAERCKPCLESRRVLQRSQQAPSKIQ